MLRNPPKLFRLINFKTQLQYPLQCGLILIKTPIGQSQFDNR
ncbi:hypothetical protein C7S17_1791 [Burkholderia thailandensis]|nr:hypothetical protein [Burkholderia thailandensis]